MAEEITNGGFETGTLSGWTASNATASTTEKYAGSYSAKLLLDVAGGGNYGDASIYQYVDLTDVDDLTFYEKPTGNAEGEVVDLNIKVRVDGNTLGTYTYTGSTWYSRSVDVSGYSGSQKVEFIASCIVFGEPETSFVYVNWYVDVASAISIPPVIGNAIMFGCNF